MSETESFILDSGVDYINLVVERGEVESLDISRALTVLAPLVASGVLFRRFQHRVSLFIDGYNADGRELFQIPEVREFLADLDAAFPYWLWFLNTRDHSLQLVATCLCSVTARRVGENTDLLAIAPADLAAFLDFHLLMLKSTAAKHAVKPQELAAIPDRVGSYFAERSTLRS